MTDQIFSEVTRLTGITRDQMSSRSRKREIIIARHGAIWLHKDNTNLTLKQIGALFGRRDHSTVLHAIECVEDCPPLDRSFRWMANVVLVGEVQAQQSEADGLRERLAEAVRLLRDLAMFQNGAPLERYRVQYEKTMEEVCVFLD